MSTGLRKLQVWSVLWVKGQFEDQSHCFSMESIKVYGEVFNRQPSEHLIIHLKPCTYVYFNIMLISRGCLDIADVQCDRDWKCLWSFAKASSARPKFMWESILSSELKPLIITLHVNSHVNSKQCNFKAYTNQWQNEIIWPDYNLFLAYWNILQTDWPSLYVQNIVYNL